MVVIEVEQAIEHPVLGIEEIIVRIAPIAHARYHTVRLSIQAMVWRRRQPAVGINNPRSHILLSRNQRAI